MPCPYCDNIERLRSFKDSYKDLITLCSLEKYTLNSLNYLGAKEKLQFTCNLNHTFFMTPDNFKNGANRCPACAFEFNITGISKLKHYISKKEILINKKISLYLCEFVNQEEMFYKIGLSTSINKRFKSVSQNYTIKYLFVKDYNYFYAGLLELFILKFFRQFRYTPTIRFSGYSECFNLGIDLNLMYFFVNEIDPIKKEGELLEYLEAN